MYLLGLIAFRKYNKITIITGIILLLATIGIQGAMGIIFYILYSNDDNFIQMYFQLLYIEGFLWALHAFFFSLSKKKVGWKHEDDDELSVESGGAFASYVPTEKKVKTKKKSKKDDEFTFDF